MGNRINFTVPPRPMRTGYKRCGAKARQGGRLIMRVPSRFHATYAMSHLAARVIAALREVDEDISSTEVEE